RGLGHAGGDGGRHRELRGALPPLLRDAAPGRGPGQAAVTRIVALTGNIAAGKSAVTAVLRARGIPVIDADAIVHELQRPGTAVFRAIHARFGDEVVATDGTLDRAV